MSATTAQPQPPPTLERGMGLLQATSTNIIGMVGVGPFLTIPFMVAAMNGPHIIYAWAAGAVLGACDGLSTRNSAPHCPAAAAATSISARRIEPFGLGRLMAFLFIFQVMLIAPLSIAGGAVGFADYLGFYWTDMSPPRTTSSRPALRRHNGAALPQTSKSVGRLAVIMLIVVLGTLGWVIVAGLFAFSAHRAFDFPPAAFTIDRPFWMALGASALLAMYSYGGYNKSATSARRCDRRSARCRGRSSCPSLLRGGALRGDEHGHPRDGSVAGSAADADDRVAVHRAHVLDPAPAASAGDRHDRLILFVTAASLYAIDSRLLAHPVRRGARRPVLPRFGRLHPTKHFPTCRCDDRRRRAAVLLLLARAAGELADSGADLAQFIWQCAAVVLIRRYRPDIPQPFRMWLYPWPAVLCGLLWLFIFATGPWQGIVFASAYLLAGVGAYFVWIRAKRQRVTG